MSEVNRARVRLLVDALRSGEFKQGRGRLGRDGEYCCLGVACLVARRNGLNLKVHVDDDSDVHFGDPDNWLEEDYAQLPNSVQDWYGFEWNDPELSGDGDQDDAKCNASTLNDDYDYDFNRIADAFERTYLAEETVSGV